MFAAACGGRAWQASGHHEHVAAGESLGLDDVLDEVGFGRAVLVAVGRAQWSSADRMILAMAIDPQIKRPDAGKGSKRVQQARERRILDDPAEDALQLVPSWPVGARARRRRSRGETGPRLFRPFWPWLWSVSI